MSVLQNINGSLYRMDASDLVQLAAVDTEGILGGTPGATTNGQTLVDQLAADDVQAQTDIGQIKTDLSDLEDDMSEYHVVPSKNKCVYPYYDTTHSENGVNYTDLGDGRIKVNTASSSSAYTQFNFWINTNPLKTIEAGVTYVLSGAPSGYSTDDARLLIAFEDANNSNRLTYICPAGGSVEFTMPSGYHFHWMSYAITGAGKTISNAIVRPMICTKADWDSDNTYEPYYVCMRDGKLDIADEQVLGAWNMLDNRLTTQTLYGITVTVGSKKEVRVTTGSSAPTQLVNFRILPEGIGLGNLIVGKTYYLTGCPAGGLEGIYCLVIGRDHIGGSYDTIVDSGNGLQFTYDGSWTCRFVLLQIGTPVGANFDKTFYPMITTKKGAPYVPYAMTNRELTTDFFTALFSHPVTLTSSDNLNDITTPGLYAVVSSVPTNAPTGMPNTFAVVLVFNMGNSAAYTQIYIQGGWRQDSKHIAIRGFGGSPAAWSAWRYVTDAAS